MLERARGPPGAGPPAALRKWRAVTQALRFARPGGEVVPVAYVALLTLSVAGTRFCARVARQHRANNVYWVVDLGARSCWQACLDPECRGWRGQALGVPLELLPEQAPQGCVLLRD